MFGVVSIIAFVIAVLMHLFGWGSGKVTAELFLLIGLACLAVHVTFGWLGPRRGAS
jgi:hypothetical protein